MRNGIGLCGAQRVGKSTLAKACGDAFNIPVIETSIGAVYEELGLSAKATYDFATRLKIQWKILERLTAQYEEMGGRVFITDRTPLCFLAYTMADVGKDNVTGDLVAELEDYKSACFHALNRYFHVTVLVQPGIGCTEELEKSAPVNLPHMEHLNVLITGFSRDNANRVQFTRIPRNVLNLAQRVKTVEESAKIATESLPQRTSQAGMIVLPAGQRLH
jgi:hypothetical protein